MTAQQIPWQGTFVSVQPRIRLDRSFDQRSHRYLGYLLGVNGTMGDEERTFTVGIGKAAQARHGFCVGDQVSGLCLPAQDPQVEPAEFYKVSQFKLLARSQEEAPAPPPWQGLAPELETHRARGHRRLAARTTDTSWWP